MKELKHLDHFDGITVNLELLALCNFKCPYCYERKKVKFQRFFSQHQINLINRALEQSHYDVRVYLMGGEPYLYPHLKEAVDLFKSNPMIKDLAIFTNGSYPEKLLDVKHYLSWHSSQNNDRFLESVKICTERNNGSVVRVLLDDLKKCKDAERIFSQYLRIEPTFLYKPTSEYSSDTQRVRLREKVLRCEDVPEFLYDGSAVSRRYVIENFKPRGCHCVQERFCINNVGNICLGCGAAVDNIFRNMSYFKDYRKITLECKSSVCAKDMFLEQAKFLC